MKVGLFAGRQVPGHCLRHGAFMWTSSQAGEKKLSLFDFWCRCVSQTWFAPTKYSSDFPANYGCHWFANSPAMQAGVSHSRSVVAAFGPFLKHGTGGFSDSDTNS